MSNVRAKSVEHDDRTWWASSTDELFARLSTAACGLSSSEAEARLKRYGPNLIGDAERIKPLDILIHQFTSPLIYILLAAMLVTIAIAHYADSIVIGVVLAINAIIGFIQEYRAENSMLALKEMIAPRAVVRRDGERVEIASTNLVPGDIILLESGDVVPADIRIVEETNLRMDETMLTGESLPAVKSADLLPRDPQIALGDRRNMAFMGTGVASGRARGVVVATGSETQMGMIAQEIRATERERTPLQVRMNRFGNVLAFVVVGASALVFIIGIMRGYTIADMFLTSVAVAVSAIPEGLPVVVTVALAVGARRMARRNAVVRRLPAVETLGSCTVILTDKTGTLTENRMTVREVSSGGHSYQVTGGGLDLHGSFVENGATVVPQFGSPLHMTLLAGLLANEADLRLRPGEPEEVVTQGDPTEVALLVAALKGGLVREDLLDRYPVLHTIPFESDRRFSATIHRDGHDHLVLLKGAPERVIEMCTDMMIDGNRPIDRDSILDEAHRLASRGLRVLAMACGRGVAAVNAVRTDRPESLTFLGLVGMIDPPRAGVVEAIERCHTAGVKVIMVTGDHATTARTIARTMGLSPSGEPVVVTEAEIARMSDGEFDATLRAATVYARMSPAAKLRITQRLKEMGEIVAVTGDGVNDAPALKSAHIGAAMGRSGTAVAKEAADMVLTDDNFATIHAAVEEGRVAFSNIRNATFFLISSGIGEVLLIICSLAIGLPLPLLPAQILWLNVVTNGIQDVALAFEPGDPDLFRRPPRSPAEGVLNRLLIGRSIITGAVMAAGSLAVFMMELSRGRELGYAQVAALTMMVVFEIVQVGNSRSETMSAFRRHPGSNPILLAGTVVAFALHVGAMYFGPTQELLRLRPLDPDTWGRILFFSLAVLIVAEVHKLMVRLSTAAR